MIIRQEIVLMCLLMASASLAAERQPHLRDGVTFYLEAGRNPDAQTAKWRQQRPDDAKLMAELAAVPTVVWLGDFSGNVADLTKRHLTNMRKQNALPILKLPMNNFTRKWLSVSRQRNCWERVKLSTENSSSMPTALF